MCLIPAKPLENKPCGHPIALVNALYWANLNGVVIREPENDSGLGLWISRSVVAQPGPLFMCGSRLNDTSLGMDRMSGRVPREIGDRVDEFLRSWVSHGRHIGLCAGVIVRDHEFTFCHGTLEVDEPAAPAADTIFEIGSVTKVLTATLLAEMHLRGEVGLDDPVNHFLPRRAHLSGPWGSEVTLRHLATHTSGLPRLPGNLRWKELFSGNPYAGYSVDRLYVYTSQCRLLTKPGSRFRYSNLGMGLLGHVLAVTAGEEFEHLLRQRVCRPLLMDDTAVSLSEEQRRRLAPGHSSGRVAANWQLSALCGAGGLHSTINDLTRLLQANLRPGKTRIGEVLELAQSLQTLRPSQPIRDPRWRASRAIMGAVILLLMSAGVLPLWARITAALIIPILIYGKAPPGPENMALGWMLRSSSEQGHPTFWHNGATGGYTSYVAFNLRTGTGVALLANSDRCVDQPGRKIIDMMCDPRAIIPASPATRGGC